MGWKMTSVKTQLANRGLVKEFSEMECCPGDRPLSDRRLAVYRKLLEDGEFRPVTWASATCRETNGTYRVNGKHTSTMLARLDGPPPPFHVTVERYDCATLTDVAALYNTFDSRLGARTVADINHAFAQTVPDLKGLPRITITLVVGAAAFAKWGDKAKDVPPAERAELMFDRQAFAKWLGATFGTGAQNRWLLRGPVVNAMLATYDRSRAAADAFWRSTFLEDDPDRDHPTRQLARWLRSAVMSGKSTGRGRRDQGFSHQSDPREMYVKCVRAWNAVRTGEPTRLQYRAKEDLPKVA